MTPPPPGRHVIGSVPRRAREAPGGAIRKRRAGGQTILQPLEGRDDPVAQRLEPVAGALFLLFNPFAIQVRYPSSLSKFAIQVRYSWAQDTSGRTGR